MPVAQKHRAISHQEKMAFSTPCRVVLGLPSLSRRVCADGRTDVRTDGRTDGHVTITSQPKFFGSIGYQICLAGFARRLHYEIYQGTIGAVLI